VGSVNVVLDTNGNVDSQLRYDPWGKQRYALNVTPTGYRYTAQRWDSGLGLYDYNARYYDPHIGRFISADTLVPDPAAPQAFNRYAYVLGNPIKFVDPSGHVPFLATAAVGAVVGVWHPSYKQLPGWGIFERSSDYQY
jgi:RHS repeat-associated protein